MPPKVVKKIAKHVVEDHDEENKNNGGYVPLVPRAVLDAELKRGHNGVKKPEPVKVVQRKPKVENDAEEIIVQDVKIVKGNKIVKPQRPTQIKGFVQKVNEVDRKDRGKNQRIFLVMTYEHDEDALERKYEVMGTTGNVYTVCIKTSPECTCPDYTTRHKRCKHIYFVLSRIMGVSHDKEDIKEYSDDDLESMISNIPAITENLKVDPSKLAKFKSLKKNSNGEVEMREISEEDMCPICLGEVLDCGEEITYCRYSCGTALHKECFDRYNEHKHDTPKCLFCYHTWTKTGGAYLNLV
jgi:hypothetical protein